MPKFYFSQRKAIIDAYAVYCTQTGSYPSLEGFLNWLANSRMGVEVVKRLREFHLEEEVG